MKSVKLKTSLLSALMLLLAVAASLPAAGSCGTLALVATKSGIDEASFVWTDDVFAAHPITGGPNFTYYYDLVPPVTSKFRISFWALGSGDPALVSGNDNGSYDPTNGFYIRTNVYAGTTYYYGGELLSIWQAPGIDGCIGANNCQGLLFEDENGQRGSFALVTAQSDANFSTFFTQPNNGSIVLVPIDAPVVQNVQGTQTGMSIEAVVPTPANGGTYPLDGCPADLQGNVYAQVVLAGGPAPADRDRTTWTLLSTTPGDLDASQFLDINCTAGQDVYLSASLTFDSGYEAAFVSENTGPIPCAMDADADDDGFPVPEDCNDANAAINPGAPELPGNSVDENCDGVAECDPAEFCIFGQYVSCVHHACNPLVDAGVITQQECSDLIQNNRRGIHEPENQDRRQFERRQKGRGQTIRLRPGVAQR